MKSLFKQILQLIFLCLPFFGIQAQDHPHVYRAPVYDAEWHQPSRHPDRIILNLPENPAHGMNVAWRTSTAVSVGYAEIAVASPAPKFWRNSIRITARTERLNLRKLESSRVDAHFHSVNFVDLEPNTLYAYRVGDGDHWSEWLQFKTASDETEPFSFLYVGDAQNYILELWSRLIRQGYKSNPDASFIIHAGDLVNHANNDKEWNEWFHAGSFIHSTVPSIAVPGNHEYRREGWRRIRKLSRYWLPQFNLPMNGPQNLLETAYFVDYQDLRIIGLNTNVDDPEQFKWLEKVLQERNSKWTICTFHHPLYSASGGRDNADLRKALKPLFDKYGVDLVLQGHDHAYARGRTNPPEYNMTSGVNKQDQTGTVYVVSVSGGKMYPLRENGWEGWDAERNRGAENTQLVQSISIDGDRLSYKSLTATGELYDAFELVKNAQGPNTFVELQSTAIAARRNDNTIPYYDQLPLEIESKLLEQYKEHRIRRVIYKEEMGTFYYSVVLLDSKDKEVNVNVDFEGKILK